MIIETTANQLYYVIPYREPELSHVWQGFRVKRSKTAVGGFALAKNARSEMVRREGCKIVKDYAERPQ